MQRAHVLNLIIISLLYLCCSEITEENETASKASDINKQTTESIIKELRRSLGENRIACSDEYLYGILNNFAIPVEIQIEELFKSLKPECESDEAFMNRINYYIISMIEKRPELVIKVLKEEIPLENRELFYANFLPSLNKNIEYESARKNLTKLTMESFVKDKLLIIMNEK